MAESVSEQEWGRAILKIQDAFIVQEQSGIGEFYRANKTKTILAISRAVEGNQDVRVGEVKEDFPQVPVIFYSQLGYQYLTSILNSPFLKACLQTELEKVGYKEPINVNVEKWELPSMGTTGILEGLERTANWVYGLPDKMTMASHAVGDSDIPDNVSALLGSSTVTADNSHDTSAKLASSTVTSREDLESSHAGDSDIPDNVSALLGSSTVTEEYSDGASATLASSTGTSLEGLQQAGPTQQQHAVQVTSQLVKLQKAPMRWLQQLQQHMHMDEANVQTWIKAFRCLQKGAAKCQVKGAASRGYQGLEQLVEEFELMMEEFELMMEGFELMKEGFKLMREVSPDYVDTIQDEMQMYFCAVLDAFSSTQNNSYSTL